MKPARKLVLAPEVEEPVAEVLHDPFGFSVSVPRSVQHAEGCVRELRTTTRSGTRITSHIYGAHQAKVLSVHPLWHMGESA